MANRFVLIVAIVFGTAVGCTKSDPPRPPGEAAITIKAGDMLKEYAANAIAADGRFKGKIIQVSGKFGSAQKAPLLGYAVQVLAEDSGDMSLAGVQCFLLQIAEQDIATVQPGDMVTLKGTCDGQVLGQVKVSKCVVIK